jgi:hypothetical protein
MSDGMAADLGLARAFAAKLPPSGRSGKISIITKTA